MIITLEEFKEMGFYSDDDELTTDCIKRAEYVLSGLSGGKAIVVAQTNGYGAKYVKQACAFQASAMMREESALRAEKAEAKDETEASVEKVSVGDFSYTRSASSSGSSSKSGSADYEPLNTNLTVIRLLRAAGCLYTGMEAAE